MTHDEDHDEDDEDHDEEEIPAIGSKEITPSPNIIEVFRNAGYELPAAIADLVDNSIDAKAKNVLVRFVRTKSALQTLQVIDDGKGMTSEELDVAMQFGSEKERSEDQHGLYGVGLKSASLSNCDSLTVVSRTRSGVVGARWTPEGARDGWKVDELDPELCRQKLLKIDAPQVNWQRSGTLILWNKVRNYSKATTPKDVDRFLKLRFQELRLHLGLHYHRIIEKGETTIHLDSFNSELGQRGPTETVRPIDPFNHPKTGKRGYPRDFRITAAGKCDLNMKMHIWPKKSNLREYKLDHVAERQGIYFYRNDRLIHGGGWGGEREDAEPHLNLARVAIDLPAEWQSEIRVFFNKSGVTVPTTFPEALRGATSDKGSIDWDTYIRDAQEVYRKKSAGSNLRPITAPGRGIPYSVKQALQRSFSMRPTDRVVLAWGDLPETEFFKIDNAADSPEISLTINNRFRKEILRGRPKTVSDAPLVRTLLYLLLEEQMGKQRLSAGDRERLTALNRALVAAAKEE